MSKHMGLWGMLRRYASGYASHSVKAKNVACSEGMLRGYASPKSNIPALHKLDILQKRKNTHITLQQQRHEWLSHSPKIQHDVCVCVLCTNI